MVHNRNRSCNYLYRFTTELDLAAKITVVTRMSYSRTKSFNKKKSSYLYGFRTDLDLVVKRRVVTRMGYSGALKKKKKKEEEEEEKKNSYLYGFRTDLDLVVNGKVVTYPIWVHNRAGSCSKWESSYLYPMGSKHG